MTEGQGCGRSGDEAATRDRRSRPRLPAFGLPSHPVLRLRGGSDAVLVDASAAGVLFESQGRLVPGQRCTLRFDVGPNGWLAAGTVRRCILVQTSGSRALVHRVAVAFDKVEDGLWVMLTRSGHSLPE